MSSMKLKILFYSLTVKNRKIHACDPAAGLQSETIGNRFEGHVDSSLQM